MSALKTLVLTSTPASPNRELHPQLLSPTKAGPRKGHLRHKSTSSALCPAVCPAAGHTLTPDKEGKEVRRGGRAEDMGKGDGVQPRPGCGAQWGGLPPRSVAWSLACHLQASVSSVGEDCAGFLW